MVDNALPPADGDEALIEGGKVMSVWEHLSELRSRIVKSLVAIVVFFGICFAFAERIIGYLKEPLVQSLPKGANALHFTGPLDVFMVDVKVGVLGAMVLAAPVWLYQFWKFFEPALYPRERKYILPFIVMSVVMFVIGVLFCYYAVLPATLDFLIGMGLEVGTPVITIKDYVSLLILMVLGFGLVFETPVLLILLGLLDIVSAEALSEYRRFVIVGIVTVSAIVTPSPDPISQLTLAIPVYLMYEASIVIIKFIKKRQAPA